MKETIRYIAIGILVARIIMVWPSDPAPPGPGPGPGPGPVIPVPPDVWPTPSAELQAAVAPVRVVMQASDRQKALQWAEAWEEYHISMMDRLQPATTGAFKADIRTAMNNAAIRLSLQNAFPGFTAALDSAFADIFGDEDVPLDWTLAKEFVSAVVWACY